MRNYISFLILVVGALIGFYGVLLYMRGIEEYSTSLMLIGTLVEIIGVVSLVRAIQKKPVHVMKNMHGLMDA